MSTVPQFISLLTAHASDAIFHREDVTTMCPCVTPEGFRDPIWHLQHPSEPDCNEAGMLLDPSEATNKAVKAFVHPVQSSAVRRLTSEQLVGMFGEIQADDHVGIFPVEWDSTLLNFYDWGNSGEDWIKYNDRFYQVVSVNLIPDPDDGSPWHHWEVGLRLISDRHPEFSFLESGSAKLGSKGSAVKA